MFSKELYELDKNTVLYMIDEMQEDLNKKDKVIKGKDKVIDKINEENDLLKKENDLLLQELEELRKSSSNK